VPTCSEIVGTSGYTGSHLEQNQVDRPAKIGIFSGGKEGAVVRGMEQPAAVDPLMAVWISVAQQAM
jgi:hypothetical protein